METALKEALRGRGFFAFPGVLLLKGPDALAFLQGQCTRDLRGLFGPLGALFLNHRGQIEEGATLFPHPEGFLLAPWGEVESLRQRLRRYIVFDRVVLERLDLYRILHADGREEVAEEGEGGWPLALFPAYALLKGLPLLEDIRGELPGAVGLEGLVDRGKGCYVGQEIMARTEGKPLPYGPVALEVLEEPEAWPAELAWQGQPIGRLKRVTWTPWGPWGFGVVRKGVPWGSVVEGARGRFRLRPYPPEGVWNEPRS